MTIECKSCRQDEQAKEIERLRAEVDRLTSKIQGATTAVEEWKNLASQLTADLKAISESSKEPFAAAESLVTALKYRLMWCESQDVFPGSHEWYRVAAEQALALIAERMAIAGLVEAKGAQ